MAAKKEKPAPLKTAAANRRARFNYEIGQTFEAGIVLAGTEVKSLRAGQSNIADSYASEKGGEMWLYNAYIPEYLQANRFNHETRRPRKLLLNKREIGRLANAVQREGMTVVPLRIYFNDQGRAKVELALAGARSSTTSATPRRSATGIGRRDDCSGTRGRGSGDGAEFPLDAGRLVLARGGRQPDGGHGGGGVPPPRHGRPLHQLRGRAGGSRRRRAWRPRHGLGRLQLFDAAQGGGDRASRRPRRIGADHGRGQLRRAPGRQVHRREHRRQGLSQVAHGRRRPRRQAGRDVRRGRRGAGDRGRTGARGSVHDHGRQPRPGPRSVAGRSPQPGDQGQGRPRRLGGGPQGARGHRHRGQCDLDRPLSGSRCAARARRLDASTPGWWWPTSSPIRPSRG